jgi:hypothetical protein
MFLATHLLRKSERAAAFAECPCAENARLNWNIALNLVRHDFLEAFDLFFKSTYLHEALCALTDGALLFNRAVANVRESKAASLYCARRQPLGWLEVPTPVLDSEEDRRLRHALEEMPLHAAAADLNDGLNQLANAIVRLAAEINIPAAELKQFHLDGTPTSKWISWGHLARVIRDADPATKVMRHFVLAQALLKCVDDPSFEFEYRHSRTHRAFPATHEQPYIDREVPKSQVLRIPRTETTAVLLDLQPTRTRLAETTRLCTELLSTVLHFLPGFGEEFGMPIKIEGHEVALTLQAKRSRIALPSRVVFGADGLILQAKVRGTLESSVVPLENRSPTRFLA